MPSKRNSRYPYHLAKLVAERLRGKGLPVPPDKVLLHLFETLYFASLKTDEGRPCRCTVNYVDPGGRQSDSTEGRGVASWTTIRFSERLPFDVRTVTKLAEAAEPTASSLAVFADGDELFLWGMVDQELRYADYVATDSAGRPQRPGLFQAAINGVGTLCVYDDYALLGSLEQDNLVHEYHDVMWSGPVHETLRDHLRATLADRPDPGDEAEAADAEELEKELLIRWQNAVCRILLNMQQFRHGGGLLIVPAYSDDGLNVKYGITYNRLPRALVSYARHQLWKRQTAQTVAEHCRRPDDVLPCEVHFDAVAYQGKLDEHKREALGCVRFIAGLSRVDGFVLLDKSLVVRGFGVETRSHGDLGEIFIAGDPGATPRLLRPSPLSQFGTRHRAMMRYCYEHPGTLGFVVSQDGDVRTTMRLGDCLVLWENVNVQLAFKTESRPATIGDPAPMMNLLQFWGRSVANLRSA